MTYMQAIAASTAGRDTSRDVYFWHGGRIEPRLSHDMLADVSELFADFARTGDLAAALATARALQTRALHDDVPWGVSTDETRYLRELVGAIASAN